MRGLNVTRGLLMHLSVALWCKASVTPFGQDWRQEWKGKKNNNHRRRIWGSWRTQVHTTMKDLNASYYTGAASASELHNLLSRHHRLDGKGIYMVVGDTSQVEGRKCCLGGPTPHPQHLMDCTVLLEKQWRGDLVDSVCPDPKIPAILISSRGVGVVNDGKEPERNGVSRHSILPPANGDGEKEHQDETAPYRPGISREPWWNRRAAHPDRHLQIHPEGEPKIIKSRIRHWRVLGLSHKVRKKRESARPSTAWMMNKKRQAMQLNNPLGWHKSKQ